jgi:hypothetical protein
MKHNFTPYNNNKVFIETGTYVGTGVLAALEAGFERIISIELSDHFYELTKSRYGILKGVEFIHGDSAKVLPELLKTINEPCTFWLDGHFMSDPNTGDPNNPVPLMEELKAIAAHPIKTHTILIDDMRLLRNKESEWKDLNYCVCDIEEFLHAINPNYCITFDKGITKDDILIARPMEAYVINLDSRSDRLEKFMKNNFPFHVKRFPAIKASCGEDGCTQSHLEVLRNQKTYPFAVFEDDCQMLVGWEEVEKALRQLPSNWDALWLGGSLRIKPEKYSENLLRFKRAYCLHAVIYNSPEMVKYILENHNTPTGINLDVFYAKKLQARFNCFMTYPLMATQTFDYSDICLNKVNYFQAIIDNYNSWVR